MSSGVVNPYVQCKAGSNTFALRRRSKRFLNNEEVNTHNSGIAWHSVHARCICASSRRRPQFPQERGSGRALVLAQGDMPMQRGKCYCAAVASGTLFAFACPPGTLQAGEPEDESSKFRPSIAHELSAGGISRIGHRDPGLIGRANGGTGTSVNFDD
jgi:hypothetical protein